MLLSFYLFFFFLLILSTKRILANAIKNSPRPQYSLPAHGHFIGRKVWTPRVQVLEEGFEPSSSTMPCCSVGSMHGTGSWVLLALLCLCLLTHGSLVFPALCRNTLFLQVCSNVFVVRFYMSPNSASLGASSQGPVSMIGIAPPYPSSHWVSRLWRAL